MRDQFPAASAGKIMIQSVDRHLYVGVTIAGEIAQQFFLFGIDAEHGIACAQIRVFEPGNVFELGIAVRVGAQRLFLARFTPRPNLCFFNSLRTVFGLTGVVFSPKRRLISPHDRFVHKTLSRTCAPCGYRVAGGEVRQQVEKVSLQLR